jgi:hypothetical protein
MELVYGLRRRCLTALCIGVVAPAWAQADAKAPPLAPPLAPLAPLARFVGNWAGTATGQSGEGTVQRSYEWVMQGRYLREVNISRYPAREAGKSDEVHEHWSMFSFDKARQTIVLRQFHIEGFVNTYRLTGAPGEVPMVFDSETFENFSNSWKARESYEFVSDDEFIETFDLAPPGKPFQVYSRNRLKRVAAK